MKLKKKQMVNDIQLKLMCSINKDTNYIELVERLDEAEKMAGRIQRRLTAWWKTITDRRFILVVTAGNKVKYEDMMTFIVDLTMLNMDEQTVHNFKVGAPEVVRRFLNNDDDGNE